VIGVTIDRIEKPGIGDIYEALRKIPQIDSCAVVCDPGRSTDDYYELIAGAPIYLSKRFPVYLTLFDSSEMAAGINPSSYRKKFLQFINRFPFHEVIYEVGNEINGEWVKGGFDLSLLAHETCKESYQKTLLTLYLNEGCYGNDESFIWTWLDNHDVSLFKELDYIGISFYEKDCKGVEPNWDLVFSRVSSYFPDSKIIIRECGSEEGHFSKKLFKKYYQNFKGNHEKFEGFFGWWYFCNQVVLSEKNTDWVAKTL